MTSSAPPAKDWYRALRRLSTDEFNMVKQIAIPEQAKKANPAKLLKFLNHVKGHLQDSRYDLGNLHGCPPWLIALHYSLRIAVNLADPEQNFPDLRQIVLAKKKILEAGCPDHYVRDFTGQTALKRLPAPPSAAAPPSPPAVPPQTPRIAPASDHPEEPKKKSKKAASAKAASSASQVDPPATSSKSTPAAPAKAPKAAARASGSRSGGGSGVGDKPDWLIAKPQPEVVMKAPAKRKMPDTPAEEEEPKGKKGKTVKAPAPEGISNIYRFLCEHNEHAWSGRDSDVEVIEPKDVPKGPVAGSSKAVPAAKSTKGGAKAPIPISASMAVRDVSEAMLIQSILRSEDIIPVATTISFLFLLLRSNRLTVFLHSGIAHSQVLANRSHPRRNRNPDETGFQQPSKTTLHQFLNMLPATVKEDLPFDEETNRYVITADWFRQMLDLSRPQEGPRCTNCLSFGGTCVIEGTPAMCRACRNKKTTNSCSLLMSGEVLGALGPEVLRYADMSNAGWKEKMENAMALGRIAAEANSTAVRTSNEYHYGLLQLLLVILKTRRGLDYGEFMDRFAGDSPTEVIHLMDVTLKLAMAQSLTAESEVHRGWVWHYVSLEDLEADLPDPFRTPWDFYQAVDDRKLTEHYGFFLIPADKDSDEKAQCVEVKAPDCLEMIIDEQKMPAGVSDVKLRNRLAVELQRFKGRPVPDDTPDGLPHPFTILRDTPGFLGKLKKLGKVTDIPNVPAPKPAPKRKGAGGKGKKAPTSKPTVESDYEPPAEVPVKKAQAPAPASEEEEEEDSDESTDPEDRFPPAPVMSAKRAGKQKAVEPVNSADEEEADEDAAGEDEVPESGIIDLEEDDMAPVDWTVPPPSFDDMMT
ncbi:hypothetical protein R3P38DRAFT_3246812 [Favolaschia claudopus]|uniref:Uncharacterized protein n=1 Tax=Favolaschia claudopus TaxID=2862362 RepID=A0AAV9YYK2_9AGAR